MWGRGGGGANGAEEEEDKQRKVERNVGEFILGGRTREGKDGRD